MFQEARKDGEWAKINCGRYLLKTKPEQIFFVNTCRSCIIITAKVKQQFSSNTVVHGRVKIR